MLALDILGYGPTMKFTICWMIYASSSIGFIVWDYDYDLSWVGVERLVRGQ